MNSDSVVFIAFEQHENLGIGYMHAVLSEAGYQVKIIDFRKDKAEILEELLQRNPLLVGFSVIFEYHIYDFRDLIEFLRSKGIQSHFTAGGHFASLRPSDLFELIPSLDSIVRFEGEHTVFDLVNHLHSDTDWKEVLGISYRNNGTVINNRLRSLEPDLDNFSIPIRSGVREYVFEKKYTTLIAGRGCIHNCKFCNIREFYRHPPGPVKRIRDPAKVIEEMEYLHKEYDCSVFLFQDDDFPLDTKKQSGWIEEFCKALRNKNLSGKIMWKINCRPDEVDLDTFELMKQHGLFRVYLGIEEGTDSGLLRLNKQLTVINNLNGIKILKKLGIGIDYGFMLFQPNTTFTSLVENLKFLEGICDDGYMPVTFVKMMPFLETKIEKDLREEGRLKGIPGFLDYDFYDRSMNDFHSFVSHSFNQWLNAPDGLSNMSKWANNYLLVFSFYNGGIAGTERLSDELRTQVSGVNRFIIETLKELLVKFESGSYDLKNDKELDYYRNSIKEKHNLALENITRIIEKVELYSLTKQFFTG